jgi:hypothetical protein
MSGNFTVFRSRSNQWAIGIGLRRSTVQDSWRWMLWASHGFGVVTVSWKKNPKATV